MFDRGLNADRWVETDQIIVQAVSLPVSGPDLLLSAVCRDGLDHWRGMPGHPLPDRREVDPAAIRSLLPYTFLVDVLESGADFRYRLIGTDIAAHTPRDNTGCLLSEVEGQGSQKQLRALYASVTGGRGPRFQRIAYRTKLGLRSWYETVVCPMATAGGDVGLLIGWAEHFHQPLGAPRS